MKPILAVLTCLLLILPADALAWKKGGPVHSSSVGMNVSGGQFNAVGANQTDQPFLNILKSNIGWAIVNGNGCSPLTTWQANMQVDANGYPTTMVLAGTGGCSATEFQIVTNSLGAVNYDGSPTYSSGTYVLKYNGSGGTVTVSESCAFVEHGGAGRDIYNCAPEFPSGFIKMHLTVSGATPIKDVGFVYSPGSTGAGGGNIVGPNEALYNAGEVWNPQFVAKTKPFAALRFMDAFSILVNPTANWADRTPLGYFSYTLNPSDFPNPNAATNIGLPPEAAIALCNEVLADCWLNIPVEFTTSAITSFATLAHNTLDPRVRAIVEYANEFFNNKWPCCGVGNYLDAQAIITGAGSRINQGIVGSVLANDIWLSVYGADASTRLVRALGGQSGFQGRNQAILSYTLPGIFTGTAASHATHFTTAPYWDFVREGYPIAWSVDADPYDKFMKQAAGNPLVIPPTTAPKCTTAGTSLHYTASSNTANCGVNGSIPATPANGTFVVVNLNQPSTMATFTASVSGAVLTVTSVPTSPLLVGTVIGQASTNIAAAHILSFGTGTGGTGTYNLDGSLGTITSQGFVAVAADLAIDGGTPYLMTFGDGENWDGNFNFQGWPAGTYVFCFTNAMISGVVTPTWRWAFGDANDLGTMPLGVLYYTQNYSDARNAGLGLIGYEAGQNFAGGNDATRRAWFFGAMRDARMGPLYSSYFTQLKSVSHGALTLHYNQIGTFGPFGLWGALEGVLQPGSPRYNAMQNFNFLLKRDIEPAANDNSPLWVSKAA